MDLLWASAMVLWVTLKSGMLAYYIDFVELIEGPYYRHLNIGAGRIVWQDIVRIDQSIRKKAFHKSEVIRASMQHAIDTNGRLHLLGLVRLLYGG